MVRKRSSRRNLPGSVAAKRNSSRKVRFLTVNADNAEINSTTLIAQAKQSAAYGEIDWNSPVWKITSSVVLRGHKQREINLHFTQHRREKQSGSETGEPFDNTTRFSDLVKAIIRKRREIGKQGASAQYQIILGFRYLHEQLQDSDFDLTTLTRSHFDAAANAAKAREIEGSAYRRVQRLEEIARILDENGIVRVRLDWQCSWNRRPASLRTRLDDLKTTDSSAVEGRGDSKLPADGIIEAVAYLYHHIPKYAWADRIRVCLISLLVITGFRIGELLTLPARRVETEDETGRKYIVYYPEKGAPPQKKWLMTAGGNLAETIIDEILDLTAEARAMAKWLSDNPAMIKVEGLNFQAETLNVAKLAQALGFKSGLRGTLDFLRLRKVAIAGRGVDACVNTSSLIKALRAESYSGPVNVVNNTGERLHLHEALSCAFVNAFNGPRPILKFAVRPVSEEQLSNFIRPKETQDAAFERYGLRGPDGKVLRVNSHAFRHWLNDLLDRGGLSDLEQAVYFGRRNPKDNRAYQTKTPAERARKAREDLKAGTIRGPVAEAIRRLPVSRQEAVLAARVQAVHVVPGGLCFHQFSQSPCPNQMACTDGCGDFHWQTDDPLARQELEFEKSVLEIAVETAAKEVAEESWGANSWLQHNARKLNQVNEAIADCAATPSGDADG